MTEQQIFISAEIDKVFEEISRIEFNLKDFANNPLKSAKQIKDKDARAGFVAFQKEARANAIIGFKDRLVELEDRKEGLNILFNEASELAGSVIETSNGTSNNNLLKIAAAVALLVVLN